MSVHYKFKSAREFDTITFDGLHISVDDLKKAISQRNRIGKSADFDLLITNAQTKEEYVDDHALIPKNTSLVIARVPLAQRTKKHWHPSDDKLNANSATPARSNAREKDVAEQTLTDLSRMTGTEEDKINAMMIQSSLDYDPSKFQKIRNTSQTGDLPLNYRCYKCNKAGHWIKNCPLNSVDGHTELKRNTGIPRSFIDAQMKEAAAAAAVGSTATATLPEMLPLPEEVPEDLICNICKDLFTDAVMIPCCGGTFCDDCVRTALIESEDNECPDCHAKGSSPGQLIPNRFLRHSVNLFKNKTGYSKPRKQTLNLQLNLIVPTAFLPAVAVSNSKFNNAASDKQAPMDHLASLSKESFNKEPDAPDSTVEPNSDQCAIQVNTNSNFTDKSSASVDLNTALSSRNEGGSVTCLVDSVDSEDSFDDNITVTVPPAHLQSGEAFRDFQLNGIRSGHVHQHSIHRMAIGLHPDGHSHTNEASATKSNTMPSSYYNNPHRNQSDVGNIHSQHSVEINADEKNNGTAYHQSRAVLHESHHLHQSDRGNASGQRHHHGGSSYHMHLHQEPHQYPPLPNSFGELPAQHVPPHHVQQQAVSHVRPYDHGTYGSATVHAPHGQPPNSQQLHHPPPHLPGPGSALNMHSGGQSLHSTPMLGANSSYSGAVRTFDQMSRSQFLSHRSGNSGFFGGPYCGSSVALSRSRNMSESVESVYHGVAAKIGTGVIEDTLTAFNRIMAEKELRKQNERRRSPHMRRPDVLRSRERRSPRSYSRSRSGSPPVRSVAIRSRSPSGNRHRDKSSSFKTRVRRSRSPLPLGPQIDRSTRDRDRRRTLRKNLSRSPQPAELDVRVKSRSRSPTLCNRGEAPGRESSVSSYRNPTDCDSKRASCPSSNCIGTRNERPPLLQPPTIGLLPIPTQFGSTVASNSIVLPSLITAQNSESSSNPFHPSNNRYKNNGATSDNSPSSSFGVIATGNAFRRSGFDDTPIGSEPPPPGFESESHRNQAPRYPRSRVLSVDRRRSVSVSDRQRHSSSTRDQVRPSGVILTGNRIDFNDNQRIRNQSEHGRESNKIRNRGEERGTSKDKDRVRKDRGGRSAKTRSSKPDISSKIRDRASTRSESDRKRDVGAASNNHSDLWQKERVRRNDVEVDISSKNSDLSSQCKRTEMVNVRESVRSTNSTRVLVVSGPSQEHHSHHYHKQDVGKTEKAQKTVTNETGDMSSDADKRDRRSKDKKRKKKEEKAVEKKKKKDRKEKEKREKELRKEQERSQKIMKTHLDVPLEVILPEVVDGGGADLSDWEKDITPVQSSAVLHSTSPRDSLVHMPPPIQHSDPMLGSPSDAAAVVYSAGTFELYPDIHPNLIPLEVSQHTIEENSVIQRSDSILDLHADDLEDADTSVEHDLDSKPNAPKHQTTTSWESEVVHDAIKPHEMSLGFDDTKVTTDVLKRSENAIFTRAINAIRPTDIKTISDRQNFETRDHILPAITTERTMSGGMASSDKDSTSILRSEDNVGCIERTIVTLGATFNSDRSQFSRKRSTSRNNEPTSRSVKDRLGTKVKDPPIQPRSSSSSPSSRNTLENNTTSKVSSVSNQSSEREQRTRERGQVVDSVKMSVSSDTGRQSPARHTDRSLKQNKNSNQQVQHTTKRRSPMAPSRRKGAAEKLTIISRSGYERDRESERERARELARNREMERLRERNPIRASQITDSNKIGEIWTKPSSSLVEIHGTSSTAPKRNRSKSLESGHLNKKQKKDVESRSDRRHGITSVSIAEHSENSPKAFGSRRNDIHVSSTTTDNTSSAQSALTSVCNSDKSLGLAQFSVKDGQARSDGLRDGSSSSSSNSDSSESSTDSGNRRRKKRKQKKVKRLKRSSSTDSNVSARKKKSKRKNKKNKKKKSKK